MWPTLSLEVIKQMQDVLKAVGVILHYIKKSIFKMSGEDIRWEQRFANFQKALHQLKEDISLSNERELSLLEKQGLIQGFEYTHELAWKTMKDLIEDSGNASIYGSKDATREAFQLGLLNDGEGWMSMIKSRNETSHTYNKKLANQIASDIIDNYLNLFIEFEKNMLIEKNKRHKNISGK